VTQFLIIGFRESNLEVERVIATGGIAGIKKIQWNLFIYYKFTTKKGGKACTRCQPKKQNALHKNTNKTHYKTKYKKQRESRPTNINWHILSNYTVAKCGKGYFKHML